MGCLKNSSTWSRKTNNVDSQFWWEQLREGPNMQHVKLGFAIKLCLLKDSPAIKFSFLYLPGWKIFFMKWGKVDGNGPCLIANLIIHLRLRSWNEKDSHPLRLVSHEGNDHLVCDWISQIPQIVVSALWHLHIRFKWNFKTQFRSIHRSFFERNQTLKCGVLHSQKFIWTACLLITCVSVNTLVSDLEV